MMSKRYGWPIGTIVAVGLLVAACTAGSGASTGPSSTAASSVAPAAAADPSAADALPSGLFIGHQTCTDSESSGVTCHQVATDPRMTGTYVGTSEVDGSHPVLTVISSDGVLTAAGGKWACTILITGKAGGAGGEDEICTGRSEYLGLTAYLHGVSGNNASDFGVLGWIVTSGTWDLAPAAQ